MTPPLVKRFLISLDQHKLIGLLSWATIVGISGIVAMQAPPPPPPSYQARGTLAFSSPPPAFTATGEQIQQQGREINEETLLAPPVIEQVAAEVGANPRQVQKQANVTLPEANQPPLILVEYTDEDRARAVAVLTELMQTMVEYSRLVNTARLRARIEALQERLSQVKPELTEAEQALYQYLTREGTGLLAAQDGSLFSAITGSQQQQRQIQLALEGIEAEINSLVSQLGLSPQEAYTSSALSADPIIANLRAQILQAETQLELLGRERRPEHPTLVELRKQKQAYEQLLRERAAEVIGTDGILTPLPNQIRQESNLDPARQELANRLVALQTQREGLIKQLETVRSTENELRQEYEQFPDKQVEQSRLVQQVALQRNLYNTLLSALVDAQSAEAETVGSLSIAQPPDPKNVAIIVGPAPTPLKTIGIGVLLGFLVAGGVIFLLSVVDNKLYTPEELRKALAGREVPLLGELPFILRLVGHNPNETPILLESNSPYLPFYERFRSNIRRLGPQSSRVVLITSIHSEEGKTVSAYNLAIASAHAGKRTLLIEADLRSPAQTLPLNVSVDPEASLEPIRYYSSRSDCIRLVPEVENLYVVPSPGPQQQAAAIIESSELRRLIEDARGRFDMVVIDTPSLSSCNDALLIEPLTDGVVLVTRPGYTQENMLTAVIDQFTEEELPLLGAVINGVEESVPLPLTDNPEVLSDQQSEEDTATTSR